MSVTCLECLITVKVYRLQCGRHKSVLQQTYYMQEHAVTLENNNADFVTELGFNLLVQGRVKDAMKCYRNAMRLDETSVTALTGRNSHIIHR